MFLSPGSEHFFRTGLAKSAFHKTIYADMPVDFYLPFIKSCADLTKELHRISPHVYQAHDAFLMFYQPYQLVYSSMKKSNKVAPLWHKVISSTINEPRFVEVNQLTRQSSELSVIASVKFLATIFKRTGVSAFDEQQKQYQKLLEGAGSDQAAARAAEELERQWAKEAKGGFAEALTAVYDFKDNAEQGREAAIAIGGQRGLGYTKEALSAWSYLKNPDEFRKRVRMLMITKKYFAEFLTAVPTSLQHQQLVSVYGGINGVTRMINERQLRDAMPSELSLAQLGDAGRALLALKIAQRQLMVYQRSASIKPVVFVDKSGSMAERFWGSGVPKISAAAGLALALHKKLGADVYLFDTECRAIEPAKVVEVLMTISADGGTNIDPVLEEIMRIGKPEYSYIVVSDGITEASEDVLKRFSESGLAKRTKVILISPSSDKYKWVQLLKELGNKHYVESLASFEEAAKKTLRELG